MTFVKQAQCQHGLGEQDALPVYALGERQHLLELAMTWSTSASPRLLSLEVPLRAFEQRLGKAPAHAGHTCSLETRLPPLLGHDQTHTRQVQGFVLQPSSLCPNEGALQKLEIPAAASTGLLVNEPLGTSFNWPGNEGQPA